MTTSFRIPSNSLRTHHPAINNTDTGNVNTISRALFICSKVLQLLWIQKMGHSL